MKFVLSAGYFFMLLYVVLLAPVRKNFKLTPAERLRLHPIVDSVKELFNRHGGTWWVHSFYFFGNLFGNIVLFMPFAFVMMWVLNMTQVWKIAVAACLLSLTIEVLQYYTARGVADIDDVILNTIGAIAGAYLCRYFQNKFNYFVHR
jgi:glycopeptide antibiotics resistance protein